jgi:hypothetical protein
LPLKLTASELQKLRTDIVKKLDYLNFQQKITGTGILKALNKRKRGVAHKTPFYYKFDLCNYKKSAERRNRI